MKKILFLLLFIPLVSFGQWTLKEINDPFDGKTSTIIHRGYGGEFPYGNPYFVIRYYHQGDLLDVYIDDLGYSGCDENLIMASFNDNPDNIHKYRVNSSRNNDAVFFKKKDIINLLSNIKKYSFVIVQFSNDCGTKRFKFNLKGSSKSINALLEKTTSFNKKALAQKEQMRIQLEKQNFEVSSKVELMIKEIDSLGINFIHSMKLKEIFKSRLNEAYENDTFDLYESVVLKEHPDFDIENNLQVKPFYKMKNDSLVSVNDTYYELSKGIFTKEIQKRIDEKNDKLINKVNSIIEKISFKDVSYSKIKRNIEAKIKFNKTNWVYDSLYVKSCECGLFESLGKVNLYFSRVSKNGFRENHRVLGDWYVKPDAPIKSKP